MLKYFHWLPVSDRMQCKIVMSTLNCFKDLALKYLKEVLKLRKTFRCTKSAFDELLLGKTILAIAGDLAFVNVAQWRNAV